MWSNQSNLTMYLLSIHMTYSLSRYWGGTADEKWSSPDALRHVSVDSVVIATISSHLEKLTPSCPVPWQAVYLCVVSSICDGTESVWTQRFLCPATTVNCGME